MRSWGQTQYPWSEPQASRHDEGTESRSQNALKAETEDHTISEKEAEMARDRETERQAGTDALIPISHKASPSCCWFYDFSAV